MATASRTLLRTASARSRMNYRRSDAAVWNGAVGGGGPERATLVSGEANSGCAFPSLLGWQRRCVSSTPRVYHGDHEEGFEHAQTVEIMWETPKDGVKKTEAKCGMNLMRVAHAHGIDLEGACEGVCACSTCHIIFEGDVFDELPESTEDEEDMLDLAFGLTETSRLGCQVVVTPDMDGIVVKLPPATRNFYVDGHVPQPH